MVVVVVVVVKKSWSKQDCSPVLDVFAVAITVAGWFLGRGCGVGIRKRSKSHLYAFPDWHYKRNNWFTLLGYGDSRKGVMLYRRFEVNLPF